MEQETKDLCSLAELAKTLGMNKSRLLYYAKFGLIRPVQIISGKKQIFIKSETLAQLEKIKNLQSKGTPLAEIAKMLKK